MCVCVSVQNVPKLAQFFPIFCVFFFKIDVWIVFSSILHWGGWGEQSITWWEKGQNLTMEGAPPPPPPTMGNPAVCHIDVKLASWVHVGMTNSLVAFNLEIWEILILFVMSKGG